MSPACIRRRWLATAAAAAAAAAWPRPAGAVESISTFVPAGLPAGYVGYVDVPRYFPETQHNVDGQFFGYCRAHGGIGTLGFPLTEEYWEPDEGHGRGRMVQYFQRARLEFDLETGEVRRSPLGEMMARAQPAVAPLPGVRYFPETGHNVGNAFLRFFVDEGEADVLGYPLSEEVVEHGHVVQWFQNARLEWWPEHPPGQQVQYGLIGEEHLRETAHRFVPEAALLPARPLTSVREWVLPPDPPRPRVPQPPVAAPILYYHHVPAPGPLRAQIRRFKAAGRTIVPLSTIVAALRGEAALPARPLALTFDDGWADQFEHAAPVLQAEDVPATFFVITRFLGTEPGYMTWDQVRVLRELGQDIESHTQNHISLDQLRQEHEASAVAEIWESLAILEARLGRTHRIFAYPNGHWDDAVVAITARVYQAAVATGGGAIQSQDLLYTMHRIKAEPAYNADTLLRQMGS